MNARITKNELIAINAKLAAENAALRAQLSAARVQPQREPASKGAALRAKRPLASFFFLKDAGCYISELKQRGCKLALTARRDDRGHFVVIAGGTSGPTTSSPRSSSTKSSYWSDHEHRTRADAHLLRSWAHRIRHMRMRYSNDIRAFGPFVVQATCLLLSTEYIMTLAQISMHFIRRDINYATALKYMMLIGVNAFTAQQLFKQLEACCGQHMTKGFGPFVVNDMRIVIYTDDMPGVIYDKVHKTGCTDLNQVSTGNERFDMRSFLQMGSGINFGTLVQIL